MIALVRKLRRRAGTPGDKANGPGENGEQNCWRMCFIEMGRGGKGRTLDASCDSGQVLEKAQNGNG
jgi:hypothetical protein